MSQRQEINLVLILFLVLTLISLGQVMSDLYLPSLPSIAREYASTANSAQFTISIYMFGYAFSQLIYGPISDPVGRRPPLLWGLGICLMGSLTCLFAPTIKLLMLGRFFQGLGAGAGVALARSIFRDVASGTKLAKYGSYLAVVNVFIVATAPLLGSFIEVYLNWRVCFILLSIYAALLLGITYLLLPETNQKIDRKRLKLKIMFADLNQLIHSHVFMGFCFCNLLSYAAVLAWVTAGPILLQTQLGLTPIQFGLVGVVTGLAFIIGGLINAFSVTRLGISTMLTIGFGCMLGSGLSLLILDLLGQVNLIAVLIPTFFLIGSSSLVFSNVYSVAFSPFPDSAGSAAALYGFMQIIGGAVASTLIAYLPDYNQLPIAIVFIVCATVSLITCRRLAHLITELT